MVLFEENSWQIWWLLIPGRPGWGHGPKLLTNITSNMAILSTFGGKSSLTVRTYLVTLHHWGVGPMDSLSQLHVFCGPSNTWDNLSLVQTTWDARIWSSDNKILFFKLFIHVNKHYNIWSISFRRKHLFILFPLKKMAIILLLVFERCYNDIKR